jgi:hypothetical protein
MKKDESELIKLFWLKFFSTKFFKITNSEKFSHGGTPTDRTDSNDTGLISVWSLGTNSIKGHMNRIRVLF